MLFSTILYAYTKTVQMPRVKHMISLLIAVIIFEGSFTLPVILTIIRSSHAIWKLLLELRLGIRGVDDYLWL
jgi:hypothetical protein